LDREFGAALTEGDFVVNKSGDDADGAEPPTMKLLLSKYIKA
jgi:hypothetical protein